jgi:hypothetical protein
MSQRKVKQYKKLAEKEIKSRGKEMLQHFLSEIKKWPLKNRIMFAFNVIFKR